MNMHSLIVRESPEVKDIAPPESDEVRDVKLHERKDVEEGNEERDA